MYYTWYLMLNIWYLLWFLTLITESYWCMINILYLMIDIWYFPSDTWYHIVDIWELISNTWCLIHEIWKFRTSIFVKKHTKLSNQISLRGCFVFKTNSRIFSIPLYKDHCCSFFTSWVIKQQKNWILNILKKHPTLGVWCAP